MLSLMLGENKRALQCSLASVLSFIFFTWIILWEKDIFFPEIMIRMLMRG